MDKFYLNLLAGGQQIGAQKRFFLTFWLSREDSTTDGVFGIN